MCDIRFAITIGLGNFIAQEVRRNQIRIRLSCAFDFAGLHAAAPRTNTASTPMATPTAQFRQPADSVPYEGLVGIVG
jgi:hypothetical protein